MIQSMKSTWRQRAGGAAVISLVAASCFLALAASAQAPATRDQSAAATAAPDSERSGGREGPAAEESSSLATPGNTPQSQGEAIRNDREAGEEVPAAPLVSAPKDPVTYDLWVLAPAIVAILLALYTRQIIPSLVAGVLVGAYMMVPCLVHDHPYARTNPVVGGFRLAAEQYVLGAVTDQKNDYGRIKIMFFSLVIGFTVGVIGRSGGSAGLVKLIAGRTGSPRRTALTTWLAGMVVFFDDYANTMIIGPTMRSVFDRVKLSRAKLAYIIDTMAAPVASLAVVGTWIGAEIGFLQTGLDQLSRGGVPAFLQDGQGNAVPAMSAFLHSLPYRFYAILAIVLCFLVTLTGRDFGPMKRSERKILSKIDPDPPASEPIGDRETGERSTWWLGFSPVAVLVIATVAILVITGYWGAGGDAVWQQSGPWWQKAAAIAGKGDACLSIFYGAILSAFMAVILTALAGVCRLKDAVDSGLEGMAKMFPAIVILILAWALSDILLNLKLGDVVVAHLKAQSFPAPWLPLAVFISAAVISFATGTSWGAMGIMYPAAIPVAARLTVGMDQGESLTLFYASVGSVLAGALFGKHCSPMGDTTVLSSLASGCRHEEHVWTQIPYAIAAAIVGMACGDVLCSVYKQPWYYGLGVGTLALILIVMIIGRRPRPSFELADA